MKGKYSAEEINQKVSEHIGIPFHELWEIFVCDCETMAIDKEALQGLQKLRDSYTVILFMGNMDSFNRFTIPALEAERVIW